MMNWKILNDEYFFTLGQKHDSRLQLQHSRKTQK